MKITTIKQTVTFNALPEDVYNLIMDEKKHAAFTGTKVKMSTEINGKFNVFDGYAYGYNIELSKGKKIVQAWHFNEEGWPDGYMSTCTFEFEKVKDKTKLTFTQRDVPEETAESLKQGWKEFYWEPMKKALNQK
jgi:activator of HSP90 ATPase